jgi:outer membrane receptor for ferrienterochelin and colicins
MNGLTICFTLLGLLSGLPGTGHTADADWGSVSGKVVDADTRAPLAAVNILVSGTNRGAATKSDGQFLLRLRPGEWSLLVQSIGYQIVKETISLKAEQTLTLDVSLQSTMLDMPQVVVTGTRNQQLYQDVPVSTQVISQEEIQRSGVTDLRDLLMEETGLNIAQDHGQGVQVQGFDPEYTLILIDGSPVIGRIAGTLDLTRFAVGNIERVEVVKGPNSSLYGSEALAGVINIITREPQHTLRFSGNGRFGSLKSYDMSGNLEFGRGLFGGTFFYNRKSREHFDLNAETISWSSPDFTDHTLSSNLTWRLHDNNKLRLTVRLFIEDQYAISSSEEGGEVLPLEQRDDISDWNISPVFESQLSSGARLMAKTYLSRYRNDSRIDYQIGDSLFSTSHFDQYYGQAEAQLDLVFSPKHHFKIGGGAISESVEADRIKGDRRSNYTLLSFFQHEWLPVEPLDIIVSGRLDAHSEFGTHFSPKGALLWKAGENYRIRGSYGSGFKAPNFSQLYLDFTNSVVGYSVFGTSNARESLQELVDRGEIREILVEPAIFADINPETSVAFNFSVEATPFEFLHLRTNVFRNDVTDLIDVQAVARKNNNQSVFTYFNLNRVFTNGIESEIGLQLTKQLKLELGYQYVIAKDKDVIDRLEAREIFKEGTSGRIRAVLPGEYSGLFNRSRNSGTAKLAYRLNNGFGVNIRAVFRGKYGLFDLNGNSILDDQSEYADPYALLNANVTIPLTQRIALAAGAENLFDYLDTQSFAGTPGRILYARFNFDWQK